MRKLSRGSVASVRRGQNRVSVLSPLSFAQAKDALHRWTVKAVKPGLARTQALLAALGRPDAAVPAIQITGTNGKGSVAALVHAALLAAGYRVGRFTSPHLEDERERIVLGSRMISRPAFVRVVSELLPALKKLHRQGEPATTFEAWTVLAALAFRQAKLDLAVVEVGMGGRLDSTSAWQKVLVSVLTHVGLDHTRELGPTLADIAREKAAIARKGVPFVSAETTPAIRRVIQEHALQVGASLVWAGVEQTDTVRILGWERKAWGLAVTLKTPDTARLTLEVGLRGEHQTRNAALAVLVLNELNRLGFSVSPAARKQGFRKVVWPGRLEKIAVRPAVFLDGAHNPAAALALADELRSFKAPVALVMGVMADKDSASMVRLLAPGVHSVWTVRPPDARGLAPEALAECFLAYGINAFPKAQLSRALTEALHAAGTQGTVVVAGSLYLLAPARRYLKKRGKRLTAPK